MYRADWKYECPECRQTITGRQIISGEYCHPWATPYIVVDPVSTLYGAISIDPESWTGRAGEDDIPRIVCEVREALNEEFPNHSISIGSGSFSVDVRCWTDNAEQAERELLEFWRFLNEKYGWFNPAKEK